MSRRPPDFFLIGAPKAGTSALHSFEQWRTYRDGSSFQSRRDSVTQGSAS